MPSEQDAAQEQITALACDFSANTVKDWLAATCHMQSICAEYEDDRASFAALAVALRAIPDMGV